MTKPTDDLTPAGLTNLIEAFGSDPSRWPEPRRTAALELLARDAAASRQLQEARALDRLLPAAPQVPRSRHDALAAGIVAEAMRARPPATAATAPVGDNVIPIDRGRAAKRPAEPRAVTPARRTGLWRSGALVAAAVGAGILIGMSELATGSARALLAAPAAPAELADLVSTFEEIGADGDEEPT
jgi:hypothetical protein